MKSNTIHRLDALELLSDGRPHKLRLWELGTGEILTYQKAVRISRHVRGGTHTVRLLDSGSIRKLRDCTLFEIDDLRIYL